MKCIDSLISSNNVSVNANDVLLICDLQAGYDVKGRYVDAVSNVSLKIYENEVIGIAGESGCGKSTFAKTIYGYTEPPLKVIKGRVFLREVANKYIDILALERHVLRDNIWWRKISYIPQNSQNVLNPTMRIKDHFAEMFKIVLKIKEKEAYKYAQEYIDMLGLPREVLNAYPHQLSGGMRQRVTIALATIFNPKIIIADEPTSALDVVNQKIALKMLKTYQEKHQSTLILISHDMELLATITDRLAIMYAGKIVEIGATEKVSEEPLHQYTIALMNSVPKIGDRSLRKGLSGQPPDLSNPPPGCRFHPRCPFAMDICRREEPPMIEVEKNRFVACWQYFAERKTFAR